MAYVIRQGPLAGRFPAVATMVIFLLVPYLALSPAVQPLAPLIAHDLHMSGQTMSLGAGMANAAYALGTVLAVQLALLLPQRRMLVLYAFLLLFGSLLVVAAQNPGMFIAGRVLQGVSTSLMLIAAVPPLALGFGTAKLPVVGMIMSMGIFGGVAAGPAIGGLQAQAHGWRPLFAIVAGIALVAFVLTLLTFEDAPALDPSAPRDPLAIGLAAAGSLAAFLGASELFSHRFLDPVSVGPLLGGLALIILLTVYQYRARRPLLTVRRMLTSTIPVGQIVIALFAAAASVSAIELTTQLLASHYGPLRIGLLFLPELAGALLTAVLLGKLLPRRAIHYLPFIGMLFLAAGIGIFRIELPPSQALTLVGSAVTGVGLGASVAPALFVAGLSLPATNLQRVFAIVELFRAVAAFMVAPIFIHFAVGTHAIGIEMWIGLGLAVAGAAVALVLYALGGARAQRPDLDRFMSGEGPAWYSPPLLAAVRGGTGRGAPEPAEEGAA
jgi:MFS family permease